MNQMQKLGGVAALIEAVAYTVGMLVEFTVLAPLRHKAHQRMSTGQAAHTCFHYSD